MTRTGIAVKADFYILHLCYWDVHTFLEENFPCEP